MSADFKNVSRTTHARQYAYCLSQRDHCCGPFTVLYGDCDCTGYISVKSVIITKYWSLSNTKHRGRISVNSSKVCFTFHRLIHSSFPSVGRGRIVDNISFAMTDRSEQKWCRESVVYLFIVLVCGCRRSLGAPLSNMEMVNSLAC